MNSCPLPSNERPKREKGGERDPVAFRLCFKRERVWLLSKITGNPTVGFPRRKKESRSTQ